MPPDKYGVHDVEDIEITTTQGSFSQSSAIGAPKVVAPWRARLQQIPRRMLFLSSFLFFGGCILLLAATICVFECDHWLGMVVVGGIMVLPGGYSMFTLVNYIRGVKGYSWQQLPGLD
eukprot:TRINITY_DN2076_c0_g1_i1.p1 TRINITY_DN2076_c0_g1~~TRINITY_DN2076_c0_g1_i1.p1  ORF type:complete len:118 (+),score=22.19 TRINITY_DN2076_c0_g1_i1:164-517(+)